MENNIEAKKNKRGIFLWIMLILSILISFQQLITLLFPITFSKIYISGPIWDYTFSLFCLIIEIIGIIGIILWEKWGVLLIAIIYLSEMFVSYEYFNPRISAMSVLGNGILLVCLIWAVRRKWFYFR